jgi:hypothetical protein
MLKAAQVMAISSQAQASYLTQRENNNLLTHNPLSLVLKRFVSVRQTQAEAKQ